jgi:hypothetical protein
MIGGRKLFGRVDQVAGLFHVATKFGHIFFVPLIPMTSYIVLDGTEDLTNFRGLEINMSLKSVLAAYLRTFLILAALYQIYLMVKLFPYMNTIRSFYLILILKCAVYLGLYFLSRKLLRAGRERALALAAKAGIDNKLIEQRFGQVPLAKV